MVLPGHLAAGYLTTFAVLKFVAPHLGVSLSSVQTLELFILGTMLGDGPDIDVLIGFFRNKTLSPKGLDGHREYLTHAPLIWLTAGLTVFVIARSFGESAYSGFFQILGLLIWLGPWSHFLCDSIADGVMWLWPFRSRTYALSYPNRGNNTHPHGWRDLFKGYFKTTTARAEAFIVIVAIIVFLNQVF